MGIALGVIGDRYNCVHKKTKENITWGDMTAFQERWDYSKHTAFFYNERNKGNTIFLFIPSISEGPQMTFRLTMSVGSSKY